MKTYLDLMSYVLRTGSHKNDRTQTGTLSIFGYQMRFNLLQGFPLVTTKKCHFHSIIHELLWFLRGDTNISYLSKNNVHIWDEWADKNGDLGPIYGAQWRYWKTPDGKFIDQIAQLVRGLKNEPDSRRHILSAWNVGEISKMAIPPCHTFVQFYVLNKTLSCQLYQRSADIFLGLPFNIASYSLLTLMLAQVCELKVGEFIHTLGDAHIYLDHKEQVTKQLKRKVYPLPAIKINTEIKDIFQFKSDDFQLLNYRFHPAIKAKVAV